jgi:hypothetical protein
MAVSDCYGYILLYCWMGGYVERDQSVMNRNRFF